jgi:uncharacterized protein involved in exopolysaccharide biosynthesis
MSEFTDECEPIQNATPIFLGVIGSRNDCNQKQILEDVMNPILQELKRTPDKVILPAEGTSTIYISDWAEILKIPSQTYEADWKRHLKRAKFLRDARIQQESTHYLIFLNKRSTFNEKLAERLAKKGSLVYTVSQEWEVKELSTPQVSSSPPSPRLEARESKQDTGKVPKQKKSKQLADLGNQCSLLDLWAS